MTKCHLALFAALLSLLFSCKPAAENHSLSEYGSRSQATQQALFEKYVIDLQNVPLTIAFRRQDSVMRAAEGDSAQWQQLVKLQEFFIFDPNSPYRNEELYIPVVDHMLNSPHATQEQQEGWFSSNRQQGKGYDNIYSFLLPSIKINITGYVMDTEGEPIPEAIVRVVGRNGMNFKSLTKPDGSYIASIDRSTEYVMMAGKTGYLNRRAQFTSDPAEEDADYEVDFYLPTISNPVLIDNIFYDYNKATLREESYPALDDLVQLLNDNPYCAIELAAHTDRVGGQPFNLDLSQRRAQSVVDYLIEQGIDEDRLTPIGYGKSVPKIIDDKLHAKYDFLPEGQELTEDFVNTLPPDQRSIADQINRRTEFQVLSTIWGLE